MKKLFLIIFLIGCISNIFAQNIEFDSQNFPDKKIRKEALNLIKKGNKYYNAKSPDYQEALNYFRQAYEINPNNAELNYKIGKCIQKKDKKNGLKYFGSANYLFKSAKADLNMIQDNMLLYAQSLQYNYKFDSAVIMFNNWLDLINNNKIENHEQPELIHKFISQCKVGDSLMRYPTRYIINRLDETVNSDYFDFSPVSYYDTLAFNSNRPVENQKIKKNKSAISNIYISTKQSDETFSEAKLIGKPFFSLYNDLITDISPDGKYILVSRNGDIYYSMRDENNEWSEMNYLGSDINTSSMEVYASFSKDMLFIYFASNCEGGYGGFDIYRADLIILRNGDLRCVNKQNLGENINSKYDEISISFSNYNNNMYIASNGEKSMGGFDIFKSFPEANNWSPLINMGYPLNSTDDEMHFIRSASSSNAYFTRSDENYNAGIYSVDIVDVENIVLIKEFETVPRHTSLQDDNQVFGFEDEVKISSYVMCLVKGYVKDAENLSPLSLRIDVMDNKTLNIVASFETHPSNGMYSISLPSGTNYGLILKDSVYMFCSQEIQIPGTSVYKVINEDIYIPKTSQDRFILLENISFLKGTDRFNSEKSQGELFRIFKVLEENSYLNIEIIGKFSYTSKILAYLVRNGIAQERITYKPPLTGMNDNITVRFFK
ncbi:MAG: tetratricopeptide repeat protein [Bacteroidales bacterium]|jgi:hypothetical protein|nr:tetratricopeptide repeat protein [Bacteroidales bacterium]